MKYRKKPSSKGYKCDPYEEEFTEGDRRRGRRKKEVKERKESALKEKSPVVKKEVRIDRTVKKIVYKKPKTAEELSLIKLEFVKRFNEGLKNKSNTGSEDEFTRLRETLD